MPVLRVIAAVATLVSASLDCAATSQVAGDNASITPIAHWEIQSTSKAQQSGAELSSPGISTHGWYPVSGRATVMAGLLENGKYENVFYDDNLRAVEVPDAGHHRFVIPWWYRAQFVLAGSTRGAHTLLRTNGMIAGADVWVN